MALSCEKSRLFKKQLKRPPASLAALFIFTLQLIQKELFRNQTNLARFNQILVGHSDRM